MLALVCFAIVPVDKIIAHVYIGTKTVPFFGMLLAEVSIEIEDVEKELFQVLIKETEIICMHVFDEIRKKHLDVTDMKHVTMKYFISLLFEDVRKLIFEKVNQDIQSANIISRNTISAFVAAEAIISSY